MSFESELKKGKFSIGECHKCQKVTWPPNDFCSNCFVELTWRQVKEPGTILEYSANQDKFIVMVEFENTIRVLGTVSATPKVGQKVRIASCGFDGVPKFSFALE